MEAVFGDLVCRIDRFDQRLDDRGNLLAVLQPTDHMALWAWAGSAGETFDFDGVPTDMVRVSVWKHAAAVNVLDDLPPTALAAPMGEAIEVTIRLVDEDGGVVEDRGVRVQVSTTLEINGIRQRKVVRTHLTDDKGRLELSFVGTDPDSTQVGDTVRMGSGRERRLPRSLGPDHAGEWSATMPSSPGTPGSHGRMRRLGRPPCGWRRRCRTTCCRDWRPAPPT